MNLQDATRLLKHHQKWRKGANTAMVKPKVLTEAIDVILKELKKLSTPKQKDNE